MNDPDKKVGTIAHVGRGGKLSCTLALALLEKERRREEYELSCGQGDMSKSVRDIDEGTDTAQREPAPRYRSSATLAPQEPTDIELENRRLYGSCSKNQRCPCGSGKKFKRCHINYE